MKIRQTFLLFIVFLLFVFVKPEAEENLLAQVEDGKVQESGDSSVTAKLQDTKEDENNSPCENTEDKNENSKLDKPDQVEPSSGEEKNVNSKSVDTDDLQQVSDSKLKTETAEECGQQPEGQAVKSEEINKVEESENPPAAVDGSKQQKNKEDENIRKTSLSDVNSQAEEDDHDQAKSAKRETSRDSPNFDLGLPRDASYFFDDLEPFINNSSDSGRVGRAAPSRQVEVNIHADNGVTNFYFYYLDKNLKSKLNGKGKELIEDDVDEDEEEKNEEDEKQDEEDYDDDEDIESDCKPTTSGCPTTCPTSPKCPATTRCPTTTPCPPPTTKCTTKHQCPTTCKTSPQCTTKCPRLCAKGNRKQMGYPLTTDKQIDWDADKKRFKNKKRKFHNKVALTAV